MAADRKFISIQLPCGATVKMIGELSEIELIKLNDIVGKLMNLTVGPQKPGRLF